MSRPPMFREARPVALHVLGSILTVSGLAMTVSTLRDSLTIWMGFYEEVLDPALVESTLGGIDAELDHALAIAAG